MKNFVFAAFLSVLTFATLGQKPQQKSASEIALSLQKLGKLVNVLYVAAHPDDENTRLIAYMSNVAMANTGYLSMTRGDGGQNLIGPEIREYLGIIRTQELLAARRTDGGKQFFTRANDFGYSKNAEETQEIWDRNQVLSDVVMTFRKFRPDIVICRFPTDGRGGHGHHTTSAILAHEAFDMAGNPQAFAESAEKYGVWNASRLYLNTGIWWAPEINEDSPDVLTIDVGTYSPILGKSISEISAVASSQHKSQGFGSTGRRGYNPEFLELQKGKTAGKDIFEGINTTWTRVKGGEIIGKMVEEAIRTYNLQDPSLSVPQLMAIRAEILRLEDRFWRENKLREVEQLIADCMGLYLESKATWYAAVPGEKVPLQMEVINRSSVPSQLVSISVLGSDSITQFTLNKNIPGAIPVNVTIPSVNPISQPYWLENEGTLGMYSVSNQSLIGLPENPSAVEVTFKVKVIDQIITYVKPVIYKWNDPVKGELYRPFIIVPPVLATPVNQVMVFADGSPKKVEVNLKVMAEGVSGILRPQLPEGWKAIPAMYSIENKKKDSESRYSFEISPPQGEQLGELLFQFETGGKIFSQGFVEIEYDHIPTQVVFPQSKVSLVKVNIKKKGNLVAYIQGAGDEIPAALRNMGYEVWEMNDEEITPDNLAKADAVVLGVRALNTREQLATSMKDILAYAENGGTVVVQYNTTGKMVTDTFAPFPMTISRTRVTKEDAPVTVINKSAAVISGPNAITNEDFEGWVQERGLYYPSVWSKEYEAILSMSDPGEPSTTGALLVTEYGKGFYVYTGLSFFREIPAGVPGALKLFVNLISLEKQVDLEKPKVKGRK